jgi:hypothetical protein
VAVHAVLVDKLGAREAFGFEASEEWHAQSASEGIEAQFARCGCVAWLELSLVTKHDDASDLVAVVGQQQGRDAVDLGVLASFVEDNDNAIACEPVLVESPVVDDGLAADVAGGCRNKATERDVIR